MIKQGAYFISTVVIIFVDKIYYQQAATQYM